MAIATPAWAGDSPAGFYYGTDSNQPYVNSSSGEYGNSFHDTFDGVSTSLGGAYGGYFGRTGGYYQNLGCGNINQNNGTDASAASTNLDSYGAGTGSAELFLLAGPGRDPAFSSSYTTTQADKWGKAQGAAAVSDFQDGDSTIVWADIEAGGGWYDLYGSDCSMTALGALNVAIGRAKVDRWVWNGFAEALSSAGLTAGMYSSRNFWDQHAMGCSNECVAGQYGYLPTIPEWTYGNQTTVQPSQSNEPSGWTLGSVGAYFFAGQTKESSTADAWQWAANYTNGGDFDQIDAGRVNG